MDDFSYNLLFLAARGYRLLPPIELLTPERIVQEHRWRARPAPSRRPFTDSAAGVGIGAIRSAALRCDAEVVEAFAGRTVILAVIRQMRGWSLPDHLAAQVQHCTTRRLRESHGLSKREKAFSHSSRIDPIDTEAWALLRSLKSLLTM